MVPRVLEPEVMDSQAEAADYDAMDHGQVNQAFVMDFLAVWKGTGKVLDVGTGTAQIPIELCRNHATAQVLGIDLAEHMLKLGKNNVQRAGLEDRIRLEKIDAKKLPFPAASFAAVISNSIIHHIPEPGGVLAEMARVLQPGGVIFVRDLLRPDNEQKVKQLVQLYAGEATAHQQQMFADSLRAALTLDEVRSLITPLGFTPDTVQQTSDRHWTWQASRV